MDLTLLSVSNNDWEYLRFQDRVMRHLALEKGFRRVVVEVSGSAKSLRELRALPHTDVVEHDVGGRVGSEAHGTALNVLTERVETKHMLVIDPDSSTVVHGWDEMCASELKGNCVAIGAPYDAHAPRYQGFPMVVFFFALTDAVRRMAIDWRPRSYAYRKVRTKLVKMLRIKDRRDPDVGWRLPLLFKKSAYTTKSFTALACDHPGAVLLAPDLRGREYHWNGEPVFSHQGRSWTRQFNVDPISRAWVKRICQYLDLPLSDMVG